MPKEAKERPKGEAQARRVAVRFQGSPNFRAEDTNSRRSGPHFEVQNFNTQGCRLKWLYKGGFKFSIGSEIELKFNIDGFPSKGEIHTGEVVRGTVVSLCDNDREISLVFARPLRLEQLGAFGPFFVKPQSATEAERLIAYNQQEKLALSDIQELQQSTRGNVERLFQLQMVGVPAIGGLLVAGALLNFESGALSGSEYAKSLQAPLSVLIPLFCAILSSVAFLIYSQKASRIRERVAFCTLLQRYIWMGAFPPCYRGWYDAQLNMRQFELRGSDRKIFRDPPPIRDRIGISRQTPFTKDPFTAAGMLSLILLPVASVLLTSFALFRAIAIGDGLDFWKVSVAGGMTVCVVLLFSALLWREYQVQKGNRSTRHLMLRYCELLKCVPPFDPLNTESLRFTHKSS